MLCIFISNTTYSTLYITQADIIETNNHCPTHDLEDASHVRVVVIVVYSYFSYCNKQTSAKIW